MIDIPLFQRINFDTQIFMIRYIFYVVTYEIIHNNNFWFYSLSKKANIYALKISGVSILPYSSKRKFLRIFSTSRMNLAEIIFLSKLLSYQDSRFTCYLVCGHLGTRHFQTLLNYLSSLYMHREKYLDIKIHF